VKPEAGKKIIAGVSIAALWLALGACTNPSEADTSSSGETRPAAAASTAATGEVQEELLEKIIADLVAQEGLQRDSIEVDRAESVIWPDGALGCPKPGEMYTQAQVPGYWVVLKSGGKQYDYRASGKGYFRRCTASFKVQLPVG
jgi:hypothetical protein